MREQLLTDSEGLYLARSRTDKNICVFSKKRIPEGKHGIRIRLRVNGNSYGAWISISSADDIADAVRHISPDNIEMYEELSPTGLVKYNKVIGEQIRCSICDEEMPKGSHGISFRNPVGHMGQTVWIHKDDECRQRFVEGIENAWDYSDELLVENL